MHKSARAKTHLISTGLVSGFVALCLPAVAMAAQNPPYISASDLNVSKLLSAPPSPTSSEGKTDLAQVIKAQNARSQADCTRARAEVNETFAVFFGPPYGPLTSAEVTSYNDLMNQIWNDAGFFAYQAKGLYTRQRPYLADPKDVHPCPGVELNPTNSFPSGHAVEATLAAETLGAIDPSRKAVFMARAKQIADDRVLTGMHYPTDIKAGALLGESIFQALQKSTSFQKDLQAVKIQSSEPSSPSKKAAAPDKSTATDKPMDEATESPTDCRTWLSEHICITKAGEGSDPTHNCVDNAQAMDKAKSFLLPIYDNLPTPFQKLFCSIPMTYIDPSPTASNLSFVYEDAKTGDKMIFLSLRNENVVKPGPYQSEGTTSDLIERQVNWVFFSALPTNPKLFPVTAFLGTNHSQIEHAVTLPTTAPIDEESYFAVVHEMGHIFDHLNNVNPIPKDGNCKWGSYPSAMSDKCKMLPNTFASIAWTSQTESIFDSAFPDRALFVDYFNGGADPGNKKIQPAPNAKMEEMLSGLYKETSFMSGLGATQPYDDWAESCVFYVLFTHFQRADHISVATPAGNIYDLTEKFSSDDNSKQSFAAKRKYLHDFFARKDLNYPPAKLLEQFFPAAKK